MGARLLMMRPSVGSRADMAKQPAALRYGVACYYAPYDRAEPELLVLLREARAEIAVHKRVLDPRSGDPGAADAAYARTCLVALYASVRAIHDALAAEAAQVMSGEVKRKRAAADDDVLERMTRMRL